jgi:hypothetical protein
MMKSEVGSQPSVVSVDLFKLLTKKSCERWCFTISELSCEFPKISSTVLCEIITFSLGYHKFYTRCVPKMLTGVQNSQRMASAFADILEQYHKDGNEFLSHIIHVTGEETWFICEC